MTEKMGRADPGARTRAAAVIGKVIDHHATGVALPKLNIRSAHVAFRDCAMR